MCYDIQQMGDKIRRQAERQYGISSIDFSQMEFNFFHVSGFSHPKILALTPKEPNKLVPLRWGLIPSWVKDAVEAEKLSRQTLNARSEGAFSKPSFRNAIRNRRCAIPVNGFYESRDIKGKKYPHFIHQPNEEICWLAGLCEEWTDRETGEIIESCSILTTEANPYMAKIHNTKRRMPVILNFDSIQDWLNPETDISMIEQLMNPYTGELESHTVSKLVNRKRDNTNIPEVSMPYEYPELEYLR